MLMTLVTLIPLAGDRGQSEEECKETEEMTNEMGQSVAQ